MYPQITSAIITGSATFASALFGSIIALSIGRKMARRQQLEQDLTQAVRDIHFLLAVEEAHCERNRQNGGESLKVRTRAGVRDISGLDFSGRFTPGNWTNKT
jgi:hypothetical protein